MNRIHKAKYRNTREGKRVVAALLALLLLFGSLLLPDMEVRADSLAVRASASSVKIGDTVTISITVPAGVSATVHLTYPSSQFSFVSASETANSNGGTVSMTLGGYGGTDTATTGTMTFRATAAGSATFSASAPVAGNQVGDQVSIGGGSASVTVQNEASGGNNGGGSGGGNSNGNSNGGGSSNGSGGGSNEGDATAKSADNSLSSLTLSEGKLSPEFKYNVVNYTAAVDYSVTSVVVSAKVSNEKATIVSVTGGDSLAVGENRIQIVVKAENGVTATYTVTVTRRAEGETGAEDPSNEPVDPPVEPAEQNYVVNGKVLYPASDMPEGLSADGFELGEITLWDRTYPAYADTFAFGELRLVYLMDENGENGDLYLLFSGSPYEAYDYVCLHSEKGFVIVLPDGSGAVPEEYSNMPATLNIEGYGSVDAWFRQESRELALIYAVNQLGARDWYVLDTADLSYMRYREPAAEEQVEEPSTEQNAPSAADPAELEKLKKQNRLIIGAAVIAVLILLIVIVLMAVAGRGKDDTDEDMLGLDEADEETGIGMEPETKDSRSAELHKRYDKSVFHKGYLTDVLTGDEESDDEASDDAVSDGADIKKQEIDDSGFAAFEAGLAEAVARELAEDNKEKDVSDIADPAPMQTVVTRKDEDDEDLEFIDL